LFFIFISHFIAKNISAGNPSVVNKPEIKAKSSTANAANIESVFYALREPKESR